MKKPNDKSSALRFLLLRYIFSYKDSVNLKTFNEVNDTLRVELLNGIFLVSWKNNNIEKKTKYKESDFNFFVRADIVSKNTNINPDLNHTNANIFAKKALLTNKESKSKKTESLFTVNNFVILILPLPLLIMFVNYDYLYFASTLVIILYLGFFKVSDFIQPIIFCLFLLLDFYYTGLVLSFIFFILIILDPNKYLIKSRLAISFLSFMFLILFLIYKNQEVNLNIYIFFYIILSLLIFVSISFLGNHFNKIFLLVPFVSLGLYLDAEIILAISSIIFSIIIMLSLRYGYLIISKQNQNKLTPNG